MIISAFTGHPVSELTVSVHWNGSLLPQNLPALSLHETPLGLLVTWTLPMVWTHMERDKIFTSEVIKMGGEFTLCHVLIVVICMLKCEHPSAPKSWSQVDRPPIFISVSLDSVYCSLRLCSVAIGEKGQMNCRRTFAVNSTSMTIRRNGCPPTAEETMKNWPVKMDHQ